MTVGDSFFGVYAREKSGTLLPGRLYVGINATNLPSFQTVQVRSFARNLQAAFAAPLHNRDPWWTLLLFYNSLRELGGASTLYKGDITSRMRALANRDGVRRRLLRVIKEISARFSQGELSQVLDDLNATYSPEYAKGEPQAIDVAAASNIIEVGVDIERLSLMGVLGQPKTTAQYIQVTGRVGRKWWQRPGLILMVYNSSKARDLSHYEQFHTYHRRLYERVEPTSATPFTSSAVLRALGGLIVAWLRQTNAEFDKTFEFDENAYTETLALIRDRAKRVLGNHWTALESVFNKQAQDIRRRWKTYSHNCWNEWNLMPDKDDPVMRSFDQYASNKQKRDPVSRPDEPPDRLMGGTPGSPR